MRLLLTLVTIAAIGGLCSFLLYLALALYHWHQDRTAARRRLWPDASGRYPVPIEAAQAVLIEQARALQQVPHTFSPHITLKGEEHPRPVAPALLPATETPPALPGRVDLADLVMSHRPSVDRILLAVGPGGVPLTVHAADLCHVALAGATGGGKSNILRLLLSQLLAAGAQVVLADPHYTPLDVDAGEDWRPIAGRLKLAPAVKASDVQHLLAWLATDELPRRLELRRAGQRVGAPLFLAIDELPAIVADVKDAPEHLSRLLREGRKVGLLTIGAAQDFLVKTIGGAGAVRDCYRTSYYVGGDQQTARVLLDMQGRVDDALLAPGLAYLRSKATTPAQLVRVPYASNAAIARLLGDDDPVADRLQPPVLDVAPATEHAPTMKPVAPAPGAAAALTPEQARIRAMFYEQGLDVAQIVKELWPEAQNGARYQQRSAEVQRVLRSAL